ncbi:AAA family ATPase [Citromicrobium bathyomarinum]
MLKIDFPNGESAILPKLTVLIGRNGSGKTRLLKRLDRHPGAESPGWLIEGDDPSDAAARRQISTTYFQSREGGAPPSNAPESVDELNQARVRDDRAVVVENFKRRRAELAPIVLAEIVRNISSDKGQHLDPNLISAPIEEIISSVQDLAVNADEAHEIARRLLTGMEPQLSNALMGAHWQFPIGNYQRATGKVSPRELTDEDFNLYENIASFAAFNVNLAQWSARWRAEKHENHYRLTFAEYENAPPALTEAQFEERYGRPPWVVANEGLAAFGFPYRFRTPPGDPRIPYRASLENEAGEELSTASLSSGELVLLRFAMSLLDFDDRKVAVSFPDLVLLDEVDSSLDPENLQVWLAAIEKSVVGDMGTHVVLSTHSPITVALAPEDSLFEQTAIGSAPTKIGRRGTRQADRRATDTIGRSGCTAAGLY